MNKLQKQYLISVSPAVKSCTPNRLKKIPFKINITCSQIVRAEQALQSQLHINIICNQAWGTDFKITVFQKYHL